MVIRFYGLKGQSQLSKLKRELAGSVVNSFDIHGGVFAVEEGFHLVGPFDEAVAAAVEVVLEADAGGVVGLVDAVEYVAALISSRSQRTEKPRPYPGSGEAARQDRFLECRSECRCCYSLR